MAGLPPGYRHIALSDTGSTNTECLDAAKAGDPGNLWITAARQLAGRGSRGRNWVSEPGNLYASLLLREPGPVARLATLTFVSSLAIRDAILACGNGAAGPAVTLKWPNDVLANGAKVSGILLESHEIGGVRHVIIGQGINVGHCPADTLHKATSLAAEGVSTGPEVVFLHLAAAMERRLRQWDRGEGVEEILADWKIHSAGIGGPARVSIPAAGIDLSGTLQDVGSDGTLLLKLPDGSIRRIAAADVFLQ